MGRCGWKLTKLSSFVAGVFYMVVIYLCEDQRRCSVLASPETFTQDPCQGEPKSLEIHFKCRPKEFQHKTVCEGQIMEMSCGRADRIAVYSATFGRSPNSTDQCPANKQGHIDCQTSGMNPVSVQCQGRRSCSVSAVESVFGDPCASGINKYLTVSYTCLPRKMIKQLQHSSSSSANKKKKKKKKKKEQEKKVLEIGDKRTTKSFGDVTDGTTIAVSDMTDDTTETHSDTSHNRSESNTPGAHADVVSGHHPTIQSPGHHPTIQSPGHPLEPSESNSVMQTTDHSIEPSKDHPSMQSIDHPAEPPESNLDRQPIDHSAEPSEDHSTMQPFDHPLEPLESHPAEAAENPPAMLPEEHPVTPPEDQTLHQFSQDYIISEQTSMASFQFETGFPTEDDNKQPPVDDVSPDDLLDVTTVEDVTLTSEHISHTELPDLQGHPKQNVGNDTTHISSSSDSSDEIQDSTSSKKPDDVAETVGTISPSHDTKIFDADHIKDHVNQPSFIDEDDDDDIHNKNNLNNQWSNRISDTGNNHTKTGSIDNTPKIHHSVIYTTKSYSMNTTLSSYIETENEGQEQASNLDPSPALTKADIILDPGYVMERNLTVLCINYTKPDVRWSLVVRPENDMTVGLLRDWFSVIHFVQAHAEKTWLYFTIGVCFGVIIMLAVILAKVCVNFHRNIRARLDVSDPTHRNTYAHNHSSLEAPMLEHSDSVDRIEVVRFSPRNTLRSQRSNSHHRDLVNYYG